MSNSSNSNNATNTSSGSVRFDRDANVTRLTCRPGIMVTSNVSVLNAYLSGSVSAFSVSLFYFFPVGGNIGDFHCLVNCACPLSNQDAFDHLENTFDIKYYIIFLQVFLGAFRPSSLVSVTLVPSVSNLFLVK